jgi:hypothetical protein
MKNFSIGFNPEEGDFSRTPKVKTKRLMCWWMIIYFVATALLVIGFFTMHGCATPATADEKVNMPAVTKDDDGIVMTQEEKCAYLGVGCTPAQIAEGEKETQEYLVQEEIKKQANEYGVDQDIALAIAECESTFDIYARNPASSAKGVYQFIDPTWKWIKASGHQFDYKENIKEFIIWYPVHPEWWSECLKKIK